MAESDEFDPSKPFTVRGKEPSAEDAFDISQPYTVRPPTRTWSEAGVDVVRSAPAALATAATSALAWPNDTANLVNMGIGGVASAIRGVTGLPNRDPNRPYEPKPGDSPQTLKEQEAIDKILGSNLGTKDIVDFAANQLTGGRYEPKGPLAKGATTAIEFLPAAVNPGSATTKALRVLIPATANEAAGQLFGGGPNEGTARTVATLLASGGQALVEGRSARNAAYANASQAERKAMGALDYFANEGGGPPIDPADIDNRTRIPGTVVSMPAALQPPNPQIAQLYSSVRAEIGGNNPLVRQEMENQQKRVDFYDANLKPPAGAIESAKNMRKAETDILRENAFNSSAGPAEQNSVKAVWNLGQRILNSGKGERDVVDREVGGILKKLIMPNPLTERIRDALGPVKATLAAPTTGQAFRADLAEAQRLLNSAQRGYTSEEDLVNGLSQLAKNQKIIGPIDNALKVIKAGDTKFKSDPRVLAGIRDSIRDRLDPLSLRETPSTKLAEGELISIRDALDNVIDKAAPGYKAYLQRYHDLSVPIDRAQFLEDLRGNLLDNSGFMTHNKVKNALEDIEAARAAGGIHQAKALTSDDVEAIRALQDDLKEAGITTLGKPHGSPTWQNKLATQTLMERMPEKFKEWFGPQVVGGAIGSGVGGFLGSVTDIPGGTAAGASVGGTLGTMVGGRVVSRSAKRAEEQSHEAQQALAEMLRNPEKYKQVAGVLAAEKAAGSPVPGIIGRSALANLLGQISGPGLINR